MQRSSRSLKQNPSSRASKTVTKANKRTLTTKPSHGRSKTPPTTPSPFKIDKKTTSTSIKDFVSAYPTSAIGQGLDYKLFFFDSNGNTEDLNQAISPWHDIPLIHSKTPAGDLIFNFICEIPRNTTAKYEINTKSPNNPIKQDVKNGQLRHFKYNTIPFNYGAFPQTWENPKHIDSMMKLGGDNDPVDVVELSPGPLKHGTVYPVKVVGALALIDEGEVDWKVLAIDVNHPVAPKLKDVSNLDAFLPSFEAKLKDWFKNYKTAEGKSQNHFGYGDKLLNKAKALEIIQECHESWAQLCQKGEKNEHGLAVKALPENFHHSQLI